jgi:hypothetical protein
MAELIESILFVLAVVVIVIVLPLLWLRHLRRARQTRDKKSRQKQRAAFEHRQLHPDYAAFAAHYGCEPPPPLRRLYEDRETVLADNFEVIVPSGDPYFVAWFEPMNEPEWPDLDGFYSFANDGCGNQFLINPRESDPEVFFNDHETGERESLGLRLSQFLVAPRKR